jgi:hypothetical protein
VNDGPPLRLRHQGACASTRGAVGRRESGYSMYHFGLLGVCAALAVLGSGAAGVSCRCNGVVRRRSITNRALPASSLVSDPGMVEPGR